MRVVKKHKLLTLALLAAFGIHSVQLYKSNAKIKALEGQLKGPAIAITKSNNLVEPSLIDAIIQVESSGNPLAYNKHTGAIGLMQLTPIIYNKVCGLTKTQAFDPIKNRNCGTLFVGHLLKKYNGNIEKTLLYYNNGHKITNRAYPVKVKKELENRN